MELYQLNSFIAVAEEGNLRKASTRLNTSQPSVSAHIKALEDELGVTLFVRSKKGMVLNDQGRHLLQKAIKVVESSKELLNEAIKIQKKPIGDLKVGINIDPDILKIKSFFEFMQKTYPQVKIRLIQVSSYKVGKYLNSGSIDCGFILGNYDFSGIETICLNSVKYVLAGAHSFKDKFKNTNEKNLVRLPWVVGTKGCSLDKILKKDFGTNREKIITVVEADDETMSKMITSGAGVGLIEKKQAETEEERGNLTFWRGKTFTLDLHCAYQKISKEDPKIRALLNCLNHIWEL